VGEQHAQRDRPLGRTQLRFALVVEAFQDLRSCKLGKEFADRLVELELALLDERMAAVAVSALVIDAIQNTESGVMSVR
jgi:hypothetical protein